MARQHSCERVCLPRVTSACTAYQQPVPLDRLKPPLRRRGLIQASDTLIAPGCPPT